MEDGGLAHLEMKFPTSRALGIGRLKKNMRVNPVPVRRETPVSPVSPWREPFEF